MKSIPHLFSSRALATGGCALLLVAALRAQTPPSSGSAADAPVKLEAFAVTGSYIKRLEQEKLLPVTVITDEDIKLRGGSTPAEIFATIPEAGRIPISESQASGADARGDIATVSLRGLGSGNTLVLLNGRRLAPHPISMPEGNSGVPSMGVNINVLPTAAIQRIEVLRDGASAIYGSDATAGVVNTILRRDYAGFEVSTRFATTEQGGGTEYRGNFAGGFAFNRGATHLVFSYDYLHRDEIRDSQRAFSRNADHRSQVPAPWNGTTSDITVDQRSDRGFFGRFQRGTVNADGTVTGSRPAGVATTAIGSTGTFYFIPTAPGGTTRTWTATAPDQGVNSSVYDFFENVNAFRFLIPASKRHNFYTSLDHEFTKGLTAFTDFTYYRADSHNEREPSRIDSTADNNITVSLNNPYNPFGTRFYSTTGAPNADGTPRLTGAPSDVVITRLTLPEFGSRLIDVRSESYRFVGGLRGTVLDKWNWETAYLYSGAKTTDIESQAIKESQLRDALARSDSAALNPFRTTFSIVNGAVTPTGTLFTNPESVLAPLRGGFYRQGKTSLGSWDARVNGTLFDLPGGPVGLALGGEYRRETYVDFRDVESGRLSAADVQRLGLRTSLIGDNNYIQVSPTDNSDARRHLFGTFAEAVVPLVGAPNRVTGVHSLELSAAGRYENYSDFGNTTKPKFGASWRLTNWLLLRGSVNEAFRAPNLAALFSGNVQRSITGASDAYRLGVSGSAADDGTGARRVSLRQGNRSLEPEESKTKTFGVVLEPPGLKSFSVGIDFWQLKQSNAIGRLDAVDIVADDSARLLAENAKQIAAGRTPAQIDLSGAGSPNVIRNPVTQQDRDLFNAYNAGKPAAQQRAPVGTIKAIAESYINAARRDLSGIDFLLAYRTPKTELGLFRATVEASYLRKFDERQSAAGAVTDLSWRDGNTHWKGSFSLQWKRGEWSAGFINLYTGRTKDSFIRTTTVTAPYISSEGFLIVEDSWLTNFNVARSFSGKAWWGNSTIRLGVNNAFNKAPPFALGASSDSDGYLRGFGDPRGRAFSLELSKRF
jgi:outer membrane receptor protein involved in Fe transport